MSIAPEVDKIVLGPELNGICMTPEEFDAVGEGEYDPDFRYELIHGVLIVSPPPLEAERDPNEELGYLLRRYQEENPQGGCLDATLPEQFVRTPDSRRRADRVIWAGLGRRPDPNSDVPTIAVEFVSYGRRNWRRDYVEKRDEYLALGIREYWIFDRFRRCLTVFRGGDKREELTVDEGDIHQTDLLPGFELPVARILAVADRWAED